MKESRNEKMLLAMDLVDEQYIDEARQIASGKVKTKERKNRTLKRASLIAACFAVAFTALNLWLFLPLQEEPLPIVIYKDSEYYPLIEKFNTYFNIYDKKPTPKNNFEKLLNKFIIAKSYPDGSALSGTPHQNSPENSMSKGPSDSLYQEITDNQVEGVIEGDKFKRSDKYIYYLYDEHSGAKKKPVISIYSIEGADSKQVSTYTVEYDYTCNYTDEVEIYLSQDCSTIYIVLPFDSYFDSTANPSYVQVQALDVSDPENVQQIAETRISGSYLSSRMVDDELLVLTDFTVKWSLNFADASTFVPKISTAEGTTIVPMENIICPDTLTTPHYTVACKLSGKSLALSDSAAFLSYASTVYVSQDNIFATRTYNDYTNNHGITMTEILGISYSEDKFNHLGSVSVPGSVKNQYSLDEYNGILRVVTSTSERYVNSQLKRIRNASLYCIDLCDWSIRAKVENFAPDGETAESVRFDQNYAYVCTAEIRTFRDPVYFFDLSDLNHITYKDTGTIDGYSTSLVNFGNGYLLGIGVGAFDYIFKIEIYRETETGVESVCAYELVGTWYSTDYKSYYIDREHQIIGLGIEQDAEYYGYPTSDEESRYLLLHFNGSELSVIFNEPLVGENPIKRGVLIDNYFYLFGVLKSSVYFKVIEVNLD